MHYVLRTLEDTRGVAELLAKDACFGMVYGLYGDLGAGKTTFARYFINSLDRKIVDIGSPSFNIVNVYNSVVGEIFHFDLYRIVEISEVEEIGIYDMIGKCIMLIEWPEIIEKILPKNTIKIMMKDAGKHRELLTF